MSASSILHNLRERAPRLFCYNAIGLGLLQRLANNRQSIYSIEGLGASGKTALALKLAWEIVENPGGYPYRIVAWLSMRVPALIPIGPTPTCSRPKPGPHTLARMCGALGELLGDRHLLDVAQRGSVPQQYVTLIAVLRERPILLVLDEVDMVVPHEATLLLELLHAIPPPSSALVTARGYHEIGFPARVTWLDDDEMDSLIARECDDARIRLTPAHQRIVREWAHSLPFAARVALHHIQHVGLVSALAYMADGPMPLIPVVLGDVLDSLRTESPDSYRSLQRLAEQDIECGMPRTDVLELLNPGNPDVAMKLLKPLLKANLVVSKPMYGHQRDAISPLLLWYLRHLRRPRRLT